MDTLLDRGSEELAVTRAYRYLLILARLRALEAFDRRWPDAPSGRSKDADRPAAAASDKA